MDYNLIDSGLGEKLEKFGAYNIVRPCSQAIWNKDNNMAIKWSQAQASFNRKNGLNWSGRQSLPKSWVIDINGLKMKLSTTDFGHLGIFPETFDLWDIIYRKITTYIKGGESNQPNFNFLNLFAYSGGATIAAAKAGAHSCHVDSSKGMVQWAKDNAEINQLSNHPIRWIVDDVNKFLSREIRRERKYDGILLDPPSYGRGKSGEIYKVEHSLSKTLENASKVLNHNGFVILTSHTPGLTPKLLENLLKKTFNRGDINSGELLLKSSSRNTLNIPNGTWASFGT